MGVHFSQLPAKTETRQSQGQGTLEGVEDEVDMLGWVAWVCVCEVSITLGYRWVKVVLGKWVERRVKKVM